MRITRSRLVHAATLATALALPASAQEVTLRSFDGDLNIRGTLLSYRDGVYRIDSLLGELDVPARSVECIGEACPPDPSEGIPGEPIELTDTAGELRIRGTLVAFTGDSYRIDTSLGELSLPATGVICTGPGCPILPVTAAVPQPPATAGETVAMPADEPAAAAAPAPDAPPSEAQPSEAAAPEAQPPAEPEGEPPAAAPQAEPPAAAPQAEPPAAAPDSELIQLARFDGTAGLRLAGPAPILNALLPALSDGLAAELDATASPSQVEFVSLARAREEGMPAGSTGLRLSRGAGAPATVLGRFTSGPDEALALLDAGEVDVVFATAPASLGDDRLADGLVLGSDGMVAVVAPENPLTEIPTEALARVFAGEITDWAELGAPAGPIRLVGLPETHSASVSLSEMLLDPAGLAPRTADILVPDVETLTSIVAGDALAIGFVNHAAHGDARPLGLVTSCGLHAMPGTDAFRSRRYPFTQAIVARQGGQSPLAAGLLDYLAGDPRILRDIGYADAAVGLQSLDDDRETLAARLADLPDGPMRSAAANALAGMEQARRLSQVLYFERGTNRLDPQSQAALGRVLDWLGENDVGEAFIVGHAPAGDEPGRALDAGRAAADLVLQEITLSAQAPRDVIFRRLSLGGMLPVVCPGDITHAASNSRVEIWIREDG